MHCSSQGIKDLLYSDVLFNMHVGRRNSMTICAAKARGLGSRTEPRWAEARGEALACSISAEH